MGWSVRRFAERETDVVDYGAGVEAGFLLLRDLWLLGGYNVAGFDDGGMPGLDRTDEGPFLSLRFKFDEETFRK